MFINYSCLSFFKYSGYGELTVILLSCLAGLILLLSGIALYHFLYTKIKYIYHKQFRKTFMPEIDMKAAKERMANISRSFTISRNRSRFDMIKMINEQAYKRIRRMKRDLSAMPARIIMLVPSARWLFDNYYLIYRELSTIIKITLPKKSSLPVISSGPLKGYYRIYLIANEIMQCSLNHLNEDSIRDLLNAYQTQSPLTSAELWAFPTLLKGCLLENILDTSNSVLENSRTKMDADLFMDKMTAQLRNSNKTIFALLKENLGKDKLENYLYLSHIIYCLKNISADDREIQDWLLDELDHDKSEHQNIVAEVIRKETNFEAVSKNTIRSLIVSLKEISEINWEDLFEKVSPIEKILRKDPADIYKTMDFQTRDHYRHQIERIAKYCRVDESRVAKKALYLAYSASTESRKTHIGVMIVGKEKDQLRKSFQDKGCFALRLKTFFHKMRGVLYFAGLFLLFAGMETALYFYMKGSLSMMVPWKQALTVLVFAVPVFSICIEIMNQLSTAIVEPAEVFSLDFSKDIPDQYRTFVVMPVILANSGQVLDYVNKLERYYLGNMQNNLYFAILGDYKDAKTRETEEDGKILSSAKTAIDELNRKYPADTMRFNLFMRYRKFNESENCWMGWERKRGKLEEFNALLLGEDDTTYDVVICNKKLLGTFRYIITLDADTELIRESAGKLVGIMAHPLNKPVLNAKKDRIVEGYSIVQSEIRNRLSSVKYSFFSNLFANNPGIDAYSNLVSDVYHDTFSEGIFYGKGIYDIRVFHKLFRGTIPENSVLSHDLLEGCYARCAFASGVKLMDQYPTGFASYIKREHRWIRGDWQLLPWLFKFSPLGVLSKWKVFDNIRRSLVQISWFILIAATLFLFPDRPFLWILFVFFSPILQYILSLRVILQKLRHPESSLCFSNIFSNQLKIIFQGLLVFVLIPHRAYISLDAIARALYRTLFSHRKMLEWTTAESFEKGFKNTLRSNIAMMPQSVVAGALLLLALPLDTLLPTKIICIIISFFWCIGPLVAFLVSRPTIPSGKPVLQEDEVVILRRHARKIWRFVEENATESNHFICPDNLQVFPVKKVTSKTSPTNVGLQLMSTLAARDMGYICLSALVNEVEKIIETVLAMEKWHGHLYNWYDIRTLEVLRPKYISTVDSGNLAGYLITVKNGLLYAVSSPVLSKARIKGLKDCLLLSGIDYAIPADEVSTEAWRQILFDLIARAGEERKAWESEKWVLILQETCIGFLNEIEDYIVAQRLESAKENDPELKSFLLSLSSESLLSLAESGNYKAADLVSRILSLTKQIEKLAQEMDFKILYDSKQSLFRIGYHVESQTPDSSKYDLLASEARQASFFAIAKGDVPQKHWFKLGRPLTIANHMQSLVSWSGSMFEYLMPELIIKSFPHSLISQSCTAMVVDQIRFGKKHDVPWGSPKRSTTVSIRIPIINTGRSVFPT